MFSLFLLRFVVEDNMSVPTSFLTFLEFSDMGCHIDGFIAIVAHTHVIQEGPVAGKAADVIAAANTAAEVALRLVRPGKKVISDPFPYVLFKHE